jgi:predicted nucleic acid-binding protein
MPEIVISDTSCLILLKKINEIELLKISYGKIFVTDVIASEFGEELPAWITIKNATDPNIIKTIQQLVDPGEASAFALALEMPETLLIIDDGTAKKVAKSLGIKTTGTLGVLIQAKKRGLIVSVKPILAKIAATDFRITQKLVNKVLELTGEK